jgi:hypothetical protein
LHLQNGGLRFSGIYSRRAIKSQEFTPAAPENGAAGVCVCGVMSQCLIGVTTRRRAK